jgi:hypothetical protein
MPDKPWLCKAGGMSRAARMNCAGDDTERSGEEERRA